MNNLLSTTLRRLLCGLAAGLLALMPQLAAAQGSPGVRVEYFNYSGTAPATIPASGAVVDRVESNINILHSTSSPAPGVGADDYMARYTGTILIPTTGAYTFQVEADDGVRLYIDCNNDGVFQSAELLIDKWVDQSTATYTASCPSTLTAGARVRFRVEYYENGGDQSIRLSWAGPSPVGSTQTVIPKGNATQGLFSGVTDSTPPTISSAVLACGATNQILVAFSETIDTVSAQTVANYSLSGGHTVTGATVTGDGTTVALTLSPSLTTTRTLTVNNVKDLAGNSVAAASTASVPFAPTTIGAGLTGNYFNQNGTARAYFSGTTVQRTDSTVDFDWGSSTPGVTGIGSDDFSVRWTGLIRVPTTGNYNFRTESDDGVRLYINGSLLIDNWTDHGPTLDTSSSVSLIAGSYVPVTLEFFERGGGAVIRLQWSAPGGSGYVAIPASQLFHCVPAAVASFSITGTGAASTCVPQTLTITALDSMGAPVANYNGTIKLTTSTGRGDWSAGTVYAPYGNLTPGTANSGNANYLFAVAGGGDRPAAAQSQPGAEPQRHGRGHHCAQFEHDLRQDQLQRQRLCLDRGRGQQGHRQQHRRRRPPARYAGVADQEGPDHRQLRRRHRFRRHAQREALAHRQRQHLDGAHRRQPRADRACSAPGEQQPRPRLHRRCRQSEPRHDRHRQIHAQPRRRLSRLCDLDDQRWHRRPSPCGPSPSSSAG